MFSSGFLRFNSIFKILILSCLIINISEDALPQEVIRTVNLTNELEVARISPVVWGIPFAKEDNIINPDNISIRKSDGTPIRASIIPLARYGGTPDSNNPIMWGLVEIGQIDLSEAKETTLQIVRDPAPATFRRSPLRIERPNLDEIIVQTGAASYRASKNNFSGFRVTLSDGTTFEPAGAFLFNRGIVNGPANIRVASFSRERILLEVKGEITTGLKYTLYIHFFRGLSLQKYQVFIENALDVEEHWGQPNANRYGSPNSIKFDDISLPFSVNDNSYTAPLGELGDGPFSEGTYADRFVVYQDSSGLPSWDIARGLVSNILPSIPAAVTRRRSQFFHNEVVLDGPNQAGGWLAGGGVLATVKNFWEAYPNALRLKNGKLEVGLFPAEFGARRFRFELRAREAVSAEFYIVHPRTTLSADALRMVSKSLLSEPRLLLQPATFASLELEYTSPLDRPATISDYLDQKGYELQFRTPTPQDSSECLEHAGVICEADNIGYPNYFAAREADHQFGKVSFGNLHTDFGENAFEGYNWKYYSLTGMFLSALREKNSTRREMYMNLALNGAKHVAVNEIFQGGPIDPFTPRHWFEGGMSGSTVFHGDHSLLQPNRNDGNPTPQMSGPVDALGLGYLLTGDPLLKNGFLQLANNIVWRVTNSLMALGGPTGAPSPEYFSNLAQSLGLQLCTGEWPNSCDGYSPETYNRAATHTMYAALRAHTVTGDSIYLEFIRRYLKFIQLYESSLPNIENLKRNCDRAHIGADFTTQIGLYIDRLHQLGRPVDSDVMALFERKIAQLTGPLWDANFSIVEQIPFMICFVWDGEVGETVWDPMDAPTFSADHGYVLNNWAAAILNPLAIGSRVLNRPELMTLYADPVFDWVTRNPNGLGRNIAYEDSKGFANWHWGHVYRYFRWLRQQEPAL